MDVGERGRTWEQVRGGSGLKYPIGGVVRWNRILKGGVGGLKYPIYGLKYSTGG